MKSLSLMVLFTGFVAVGWPFSVQAKENDLSDCITCKLNSNGGLTGTGTAGGPAPYNPSTGSVISVTGGGSSNGGSSGTNGGSTTSTPVGTTTGTIYVPPGNTNGIVADPGGTTATTNPTLTNGGPVIPSGTTTSGSTTGPTPPTCKLPKETDAAGNCRFIAEHHACDDGSASGLASAVSTHITGSTAAARFQNTVNKKLACCLNLFSTGDAYAKFDCVQNSKTHYTNFDELWDSADTAAQGGQSNAMVLTNSMGKPMSGFYTLKGTRCHEFSEFAGTIQPARVDSMTGDTVKPLPGPSYTGPSSLKLPGTRIPTTAAERRRCPILVRAALVVQCPTNPVSPSATQRTYEDTSSLPSIIRCATASSMQVHIRMEQITEIAKMPRMLPVDTVIDQRNAAAISIERILADKYGNQCPPGSHQSGDACVDN